MNSTPHRESFSHNPRINSTYIPGLGTVRACLDCGCLVAGGPTRCLRCAHDLDVAKPAWPRRASNVLARLWRAAVGGEGAR